MARNEKNQRVGSAYLIAFVVIILVDVVLFGVHANLFVRAWKEEDKESILELVICTTHFLTNSIAISDLFVHLVKFNSDSSCAFEPAKSTNAFLFSLVGSYADLAGVALAVPGTAIRNLAWAMFSESIASAAISIACYVWGRGTIDLCERADVTKTLSESGTRKLSLE